MKREYHRWYSHRLGMELGVVVYGHWGPPLLGFPTSAGDEWELEGQSMVGALAEFIDAGRIKFFSVNSINGQSFYNKSAHPFHRSYVQVVFDSYLREEVVPFIWNNCQSPGMAISTMGASFGAYHAANSLFKHPDVIKRCFAMSGVYDLRNFMDGTIPSITSRTPATPGSTGRSPVVTFTLAPVRVLGRTVGLPTVSQKFSPARASVIRWTTGARRAATTGPTGSTR